MQQVQLSHVTIPGANGTRYAIVWHGRSRTTISSLALAEAEAPAGGTYRNLRVSSPTALTGAQQIVFALYVNGAASALSITLNSGNQEATNVADDVAVSAGDDIAWEIISTNTPPSITAKVAFDFEPTIANTSCYGFGGAVFLGTPPTRDSLLFGDANNDITWSADSVDTRDIIGLAGTINSMRVKVDVTPGGGTSRTWTIYKNNVAQDGSGGTPDTRLTISAGGLSGSSSFSLSVDVGDAVHVRHTVTGSPSTGHRAIGTVSFVSSTADRWMVGSTVINNPSNSTVQFNRLYGTDGAYSNTESDRQFKNGPTPFFLSAMIMRIATAPGSGNSYDWTVRLAAADTAQTTHFEDLNTQVGPSGGAAVTVADGSLVSMESTPTSAPTQPGTHAWCLVAANAATTKEGCFVAGVNTTVRATRSAAFGLDGNTNVQDVEGELCIFGDLRVTGNTTLAAGSVNLSALLDGLGT